MAKIGEIDTMEQKRKRVHVFADKRVEWRIPEFSSIAKYEDSFKVHESPTFSVAGVSFYFRLFPCNCVFPDDVRFELISQYIRDFSVEYNFGLKTLDGNVEQLQGGILKGGDTCGAVRGVVSSKMLRQRPELMPGNVLTLTCMLKPDAIHSIETTEFENQKEFKLIKLDKLSQNFKDLYGDKETCNVTLKVKDKEYKAHRLVLMARSAVFAAIFKHDTLERQTGVITITDCDADSFPEFLEYLYCGKLEGMSFHSALNLYYTSDKYDVEDLKTFCLEYLMQSLTVENICEVVAFADKYEEAALFSAAQDFFNKNSDNILVTSEWDGLLATNHRLANKLFIAMPKGKFCDCILK